MKKLTKTLLALGVTLSMFGCGTEGGSEEVKKEDPVEETTQEAYTIMDELPDFDYTPINYKNKGYIVSVDGNFGVMDGYGNWLKETKYGSLFSAFISDGNMTYCAIPTGEAVMGGGSSFNALFDENSDYSFCANSGFGGVVLEYFVMKDEGGEYVPYYHTVEEPFNEILSKEYDPNTAFRYADSQIAYFYNGEGNSLDYDHYCIVTKSGNVYGKFDRTFDAAINMVRWDYGSTFQRFYGIGNDIFGCIVIPQGSQYQIISNDGSSTFETLVDSYEFLDKDTIKYNAGNTVGILDKDLNVLIESDEFEDISAPMDGLFFAKKDGKWHVVRDNSISDDNLYQAPQIYEDKGVSYVAQYEMTIRNMPSTSGDKVGYIHENEKISVLETVTSDDEDGSKWGRIGDNKWVCLQDLDYIYFNIQ